MLNLILEVDLVSDIFIQKSTIAIFKNIHSHFLNSSFASKIHTQAFIDDLQLYSKVCRSFEPDVSQTNDVCS